MRKTGKPRGDRIAAWTAVFIVHMALAWMLMRPPAQRDGPTTDDALDVVWIVAPRPVPSTARRRAHAAAPHRSAAIPRPAPRPHAEMVAPVSETSVPASAPLSVVSIAQAVEAAARTAPGSFQADPFAHRSVRLPGRAANTFRMRPSPSLAERVAKVGQLFGGGDDPCGSARDSINALSQAGDSRELQNALDYEKRFCR